jgi:hypothetical protein
MPQELGASKAELAKHAIQVMLLLVMYIQLVTKEYRPWPFLGQSCADLKFRMGTRYEH